MQIAYLVWAVMYREHDSTLATAVCSLLLEPVSLQLCGYHCLRPVLHVLDYGIKRDTPKLSDAVFGIPMTMRISSVLWLSIVERDACIMRCLRTGRAV